MWGLGVICSWSGPNKNLKPTQLCYGSNADVKPKEAAPTSNKKAMFKVEAQ